MSGSVSPRFSVIAAMTPSRVIGAGNRLPWHLPADLRFFRDTTRGHAVVMGRKTFESIGRPLPERVNVVVTKNPEYPVPQGVWIAGSLEEAAALVGRIAPRDEEPFIIGGGALYAEALRIDQRRRAAGDAFLDKLYITLVHADIQGDAFFPAFEGHLWQVTSRAERPADEKNEYDCSFLVYEAAR